MIFHIEKTFDSTMTVLRQQEIQKPNGSYEMKEVEIYKDVPCGLYVFRSEEYDTRRTVQPVTGDYQVYYSLDYKLTKGDKVVVNNYGNIVECLAGMPMRYESHNEVVCRQRDLADEGKIT